MWNFLNSVARDGADSLMRTLVMLMLLAVLAGGGVVWLVWLLRSDAVDDFRLEQIEDQSQRDQELRDAQRENADAAARGDVRDRLRDGGAVFAVPDQLRDAD